MPFSKQTALGIAQDLERQVNLMSLHTADPGPSGLNHEYIGAAYKRQKYQLDVPNDTTKPGGWVMFNKNKIEFHTAEPGIIGFFSFWHRALKPDGSVHSDTCLFTGCFGKSYVMGATDGPLPAHNVIIIPAGIFDIGIGFVEWDESICDSVSHLAPPVDAKRMGVK